jgi:hypothetical protein
MKTDDFTLTNNITLLYANEDTSHLNYNGSTTKPDNNLASTDIADVAEENCDHPRCEHRMAVTVNFRTKTKNTQ